MRILSSVFAVVLLTSISVKAQEIHGKKLLKQAVSLEANDDTRGAIDLINSNLEKNGKYQSDIDLKLAALQVNAYLLDSAKISLSRAESFNNEKILEEIILLKQTLASKKEHYQIAVALGNKFLIEKNNDSALASFNEAITFDTGNYEAYLGFGEIEENSGEIDASIVSFKQALTKYNNDIHEQSHVYEHLAKAYLAKRMAKEAISVCDAGIEIDPTNQELIFRKGQGQYYQRNFRFAISSFNQFINSGGKVTEAYGYRANCFYEIKKYEEAVSDFNQALAIDSTLTEAYYQRGLSYYQLKKYDNAKSDFEYLITLNENNFVAYNAVGVCDYANGNFKEAVANFEKTVKISTSQSYQYNLGMAYFENNQFDEALVVFNTLGKLNRDEPKYNVMHCKVLLAKKDYNSANEWVEASMKTNPYVKEYLEVSGEIYDKLGRTLDSKDMISRTNDIYGDPVDFTLKF